jgi:tetratricopeptide (TPR) repeat protein
MTEPDAMDVALADAYREASLAGIDMRVATEQLEHVRGIARDGSLAVEAMIAFSEQIAAAAAVDALCVVLRTLRDAVVDAKLAAEAARLQAATAANPETGHAAWLGAIAHAVGIGTVDLAARFAATPLDPAPSNRDMVLTGIEATRNARWREAVPVLNLLGYESRIPARQRAVVLAMLAEIHWIVREDAAAARACLKEAEALSADNWRVVFSAGRLAEQRPRTDESVANSERLLSRANELAGGRHSGPLLKLGILRRDAGDLAGAEAFFTRATAATVFPADAYTALIELAGDRALFPSRRDQIKSLVRRAELTAIDTGEAYDAMIAAAEAMHTNEIRDGFDRWIERAMAFSPARFTAYLQRGYYNLEAAELDAAEQDFASAVERAPEAPEGWWGRASVAEERRNWPVLLEMATKTLEYAPGWSRGRTAWWPVTSLWRGRCTIGWMPPFLPRTKRGCRTPIRRAIYISSRVIMPRPRTAIAGAWSAHPMMAACTAIWHWRWSELPGTIRWATIARRWRRPRRQRTSLPPRRIWRNPIAGCGAGRHSSNGSDRHPAHRRARSIAFGYFSPSP